MISLKRLLTSYSFRMGLFSLLAISIFGCFFGAITLGISGCERIDDEPEGPGEIIIGITDTEGDFIRYMVDVVSLALTKADGSVVETLPVSTDVDFTQYTEMTEFLTTASIPSGFYIKATITLDYRNADIWVENDTGEAEKIYTILDVDGNAVTTLGASVHLEGSSSLLIAPGIPAHLTLDFNLDASNKIDENDPNVLIVQPILLADVILENPKLHRLRGPLKEVDVSQGNFLVIIRPFIHLISGGDERFGVLRVTTNSNTVYAIDGNLYQGQEGLNKLNERNISSPFTPTIVIGDPKPNPFRFEAREVRAGSDVPGGALDAVTGNVTSRDLNSLIVKGATFIRSNGSVVFNDTVTIYLDTNTRVDRQFSTRSSYNTNDISVGQRITVFGESSTDSELDADFVHLQMTTLRGTVNMVDDILNQIDITLNAIDGRRIGIFNFQGTGFNTETDADPDNYEIATGNINISSLDTGSPVKVLGFVNAFGNVPKDPEDFKAQTVVDVSGVPALMNVSWFPANPNAFEELLPEGIAISLDGVGLFHHIGRAGVVIELNESPIIKPDPDNGGFGFFSISQDWTRHLHTSFENFVADLNSRLMEDASVKYLTAIGRFNDENSTLTASHINVLLVK